MSFNRLKYDNYNVEINRSIAPGDYRLLEDYNKNINNCFSYNGPIGSKSDVSTAENITDVESELSWRRRILTNNITDDIDNLKSFKTINKNICSKILTSQDTRFSHPLSSYRSMSTTDLQLQPYIPINPQSVIQDLKEKSGINSRLDLKDNFKSPEPKYNDNFFDLLILDKVF